MSIEAQKAVADKVLDMLFPIDPFAIVAGGAPRDWHFGKEASDIDVFLHTSVAQLTIIYDMLKSTGLTVSDVKIADGLPEWYKLNEDLRAVFDCVVDGVPVQIMVMNTPTFKSVIPKFPFSICKAWYKFGQIRLDREFLIGEKHKLIMKTNTVYADEHKYVQKIRDKFKGYKFFGDVESAKNYIFKYGAI